MIDSSGSFNLSRAYQGEGEGEGEGAGEGAGEGEGEGDTESSATNALLSRGVRCTIVRTICPAAAAYLESFVGWMGLIRMQSAGWCSEASRRHAPLTVMVRVRVRIRVRVRVRVRVSSDRSRHGIPLTLPLVCTARVQPRLQEVPG